jgi:hypothetical protein
MYFDAIVVGVMVGHLFSKAGVMISKSAQRRGEYE